MDVINWYLTKHSDYEGNNTPSSASLMQLEVLKQNILTPIHNSLGTLRITYGFTSHPLLRHILKHSSGDMAPDIDQHASMEVNSRGNRICKRDGAACDFYVEGFEQRMHEVAKFICKNLEFDRLYFYGVDKPLHISIGPDNSRYAFIRKTRSDGVRVNGRSAKGAATPTLFDDL
ncbi:hypothetical protein [Vibrio diazotrophicus]|uniref:hypothetical protein n=1 Tax=Vibrio diazotrophicus TaxID=685 RepID=UPI0039C8A37F